MNIADSIQEYLLASRLRESSEHSAGKFYLSDMGKCLRMRYFKRKGVETEFDPFVNWVFKMGDLLHEYGYKALESKGLLLEAEDNIEIEHFKGRYDGIVKNGDEKSVFDFKSVGSYKLQKVMKGEDDEDYIGQLLSYTMLLKDAGKDVSETAYVVYINKEPSDKLPVMFFQREYHLTTWRRKQLQEEMDKLVNFWTKEIVPPCTCPSWMKDYNSFQPICSATDVEIKKFVKYLDDGKKLVSTKRTLYLVENHTRKEVKTL